MGTSGIFPLKQGKLKMDLRKADKGGKVCRATLIVETNEDGSDPWPLVKTALRPPPWGRWVGSHIWENFPKKVFFLDTFPY